jgi:predicted transcriptional regulator of viral defense system
MPQERVVTTLSRISAPASGVFRARHAREFGISPTQLARLSEQGVIERVLPHTYRMTAVAPSATQRRRAALLWAGDEAAAAGRSAGELYRLEGVRARTPEIVLPHHVRARTPYAIVYHADPRVLMVRTVGGFRVTGVEATLLLLAHVLDEEGFEMRVRTPAVVGSRRSRHYARPWIASASAAAGASRRLADCWSSSTRSTQHDRRSR